MMHISRPGAQINAGDCSPESYYQVTKGQSLYEIDRSLLPQEDDYVSNME